MTFGEAKVSDYKAISKIHISAFQDFFLTSLGKKFLETYYKSCLKSDQTIAVCAYNELGEIVGFATGCKVSKGYHKNIFLKNIFPFTFALVGSICRNPLILKRLFVNLDKKAEVSDDKDYAELLSIGILPELKGSGLGKQLISEFELNAQREGVSKVTLTTDFHNNDAVIGFYKKMGYEVMYEFITYPERKMLKLLKNIDL